MKMPEMGSCLFPVFLCLNMMRFFAKRGDPLYVLLPPLCFKNS